MSNIPNAVLQIASPHAVRPIANRLGYFIADDGRAISIYVPGSNTRRLDPSKPRVLKQQTSQNGYPFVFLNRQASYIHHLVLNAFVGPRPAYTECCHNDGNRANNVLTNLRWDSPQSNVQDAIKHGTHSPPPVNNVRGSRNGQSKLTADDVRTIRALLSEGILLHREIAASFNISPGSVSDIKHRRSWAWLD